MMTLRKIVMMFFSLQFSLLGRCVYYSIGQRRWYVAPSAEQMIAMIRDLRPKNVEKLKSLFEDLALSPVTILDVGANIGYTALRFKQIFPVAKIVCFEPYTPNLIYLSTNLKNTGVAIISLGLSDSNSQLQFGIPEYVRHVPSKSVNNTGRVSASSGVPTIKENRHSGFVVRGTSLINLLDLDVDFIKIDVEGMETQVLAGLADLANICKPVIQFEFNPQVLSGNEPDELDLAGLKAAIKMFDGYSAFEYVETGFVNVGDLSELDSFTEVFLVPNNKKVNEASAN